MSTNKLSHSSVTKFQTCPRSYAYHYRDRLRTKISSAALLFGSAIDVAIQELLKSKDLSQASSVFEQSWTTSEINGVSTHLPSCTEIAYSKNDVDIDLLSDNSRNVLITAYGNEWEIKLASILEKQRNKVPFKFLPKEQKALLNLYSWHCLLTKGYLMLKTVHSEILPKITEVLSIQEKVELANEEGDAVIGYVDLVCRMRDYEKPVIIDFKTSSIEYDEDVVLTSPQLTLYMHALSEKYENTRNAGFIVLHKNVKKNKTKVCSKCSHDGTGTRFKTCNNEVDGVRCDGEWKETMRPEIRTQIIIDPIPQQTENLILENIDDINKAIKNEIFTRNLGSCIAGWGKCPYYSKCYYGDESDLIKLADKKE
jgi:PD-(D/E)XK nuclease superfamily